MRARKFEAMNLFVCFMNENSFLIKPTNQCPQKEAFHVGIKKSQILARRNKIRFFAKKCSSDIAAIRNF